MTRHWSATNFTYKEIHFRNTQCYLFLVSIIIRVTLFVFCFAFNFISHKSRKGYYKRWGVPFARGIQVMLADPLVQNWSYKHW